MFPPTLPIPSKDASNNHLVTHLPSKLQSNPVLTDENGNWEPFLFLLLQLYYYVIKVVVAYIREIRLYLQPKSKTTDIGAMHYGTMNFASNLSIELLCFRIYRMTFEIIWRYLIIIIRSKFNYTYSIWFIIQFFSR